MTNKKLHHLLSTRFSHEELRTLCFLQLEIDYDDLPGEGKASKARELMIYLQRRGQLNRLVKFIEQERPDIFAAEMDGPGIEMNESDAVDLPPELPERKPVETRVGVLAMRLEPDGDGWAMQARNAGEGGLRHVTISLSPSITVAAHPTQIKLGTLAKEQIKTSERLVIRPRQASGTVCELEFDVVYLTDDGRERHNGKFNIST